MWITSEVEIPDELIDHIEQGKLVLFVGAGVSMKGKSNLPNFDDLVDEIAKTLYVEKREITEPHDYYLGKIAKTKRCTSSRKRSCSYREIKTESIALCNSKVISFRYRYPHCNNKF